MLHHGGHAEDPQTAERLRHLARSLLQRCDPAAMVPHSAPWRLGDAWPYGPLSVLEALWQRLGIADLLAEQRPGRQLDCAVDRALWAMVANRAWAPGAPLDGSEQGLRADVRLAGTDTRALPPLSRALARLAAHQDGRAPALYGRRAALLNLAGALIFYATTS